MNALRQVLEELKQNKEFQANVTTWKIIPSRKAETVPLPENLLPLLREALQSRGIGELYSHQSASWKLLGEGKHVVIVTPTASGKTLCYNLPILQTLLETPQSRALYLFPTKALSQDQQAALNEIILGGDLPLKIVTYDGDTPPSLRMAARQGGRIIISNPDMLHSGILPNHTKWVEFFKNLRYIVLDELHTYTGVFGAHMTNVLRRLKRVAAFYGSSPQFVGASATIANPKELAETLLEKPVTLVDKSGAASGEKHLVLYNPPLVDPVQGIRRGVVLESRRWAQKLLKGGVKTIIFARSRINAELISSYVNKSLANVFNENQRIRVESYRGGYLPKERREVERGLRDGSIQGVAATNALELGIDIGGMDAAILAGFPPSSASAWQQAGRAGRSGDVSLALMIGSASPTDQYLVRHPDYFLGRSPESAFVDPSNLYILLDHLKCAVFELPFGEDEEFGGDTKDLLAYLEEQGVLRGTGGRWYWADRSYPSERISLRSGAEANVVILNVTGNQNKVIGEMDAHSAREMLHQGAVYIHRGETYLVKSLDLQQHHAYVEVSSVNYYTDALTKSDIKVLTQDSQSREAGLLSSQGDLLVRSQVGKYKKIRFGTHENVGYGEVNLPEIEMHTQGLFLLLDAGLPSGKAWERVEESMRAPVLSRLAALLRNLIPLFLLCRPRDIGVAGRVRDPHYQGPGIFIYDNFPGGLGISDGLQGRWEEILAACREQLDACPCQEGCPSCIGPKDQRDKLGANPKAAITAFLRHWEREGDAAGENQ